MIRRLRPAAAAVAAACVVTLSACATVDVNSIPPPGKSYGDGYDLVMQFESVLNLPDRAKVVLDGVNVGVVSDVALSDRDVEVTARIANGVSVPSDIHAVLQQATVLGDIYIALERPQGEAPASASALPEGAVIPVSQTTSPPQLEDTIATMANFVSSGSIQRAQNTVIRLNRVVPASDEVRTLTARVETDLSALSDNINQVDELLDSAAKTAEVVQGHIPQLQYWFSPTGQRGFEHLIALANYTSTVLPGIGSITLGGYWLVPFLKSLTDATVSLQQSKVATESEIPLYRRLFTDFFLPADKYPAINITSIVGPDGRELSGNVQEVLRILGAMP